MVSLRSLPGFAGIPDSEMTQLEQIMVPETHHAGTTLFREGDEADDLYIVLAGKVSIVKEVWGGKVLDTLGSGQFFGEMGVLGDAPRCASARAVTDVSLLRVRGSNFRALLTRSPSLAMRIMTTVSRRNRDNMSLEQMQWAKTDLPEPKRRGRVLVVCSMTGGAGTSTVVCNLGHELGRQSAGNVCLVDASVEFGDLALMLDVVPTLTLADLAGGESLTAEEVGRTVLRTAAGMELLAAPLRPEQGDVLTGEFFRQLLVVLRSRYDYIVIDTCRGMQDPLPVLLEEADEIVYVLSPKLQALKNARLWSEVLGQMKLLDERVHFVVNGAPAAAGPLDRAAIEKAIGVTCTAVIPADPVHVAEAVEQGAVLSREEPDCEVSRAFSALATELLEPQAPVEGRLAWIRKPQWLRNLKSAATPLLARSGAFGR